MPCRSITRIAEWGKYAKRGRFYRVSGFLEVAISNAAVPGMQCSCSPAPAGFVTTDRQNSVRQRLYSPSLITIGFRSRDATASKEKLALNRLSMAAPASRRASRSRRSGSIEPTATTPSELGRLKT